MLDQAAKGTAEEFISLTHQSLIAGKSQSSIFISLFGIWACTPWLIHECARNITCTAIHSGMIQLEYKVTAIQGDMMVLILVQAEGISKNKVRGKKEKKNIHQIDEFLS